MTSAQKSIIYYYHHGVFKHFTKSSIPAIHMVSAHPLSVVVVQLKCDFYLLLNGHVRVTLHGYSKYFFLSWTYKLLNSFDTEY